ncbi:multicopper oxidase [Aaosphaeria arxii CBS 175.79]|uniref:laccase n=1 Tax=Aaosphaeria arxii CBS 175.79 TaxID=1450172 RepID=A0A6A5Y063_9PLEO|nr:multicopper oxidase [Aaosphaeria arxii CBS 175.79]KAF2018573.1 multicopper oxidase [Aaosphaeria arxii CBS 175.79]
MLLNRVAYLLSFGSLAIAGALPPSRVIAERQASTSSPVPDGQCTNGPRTRNCWSEGFSIATDFDAKAPPAGKTVTYNLEVTNTTINADGNGTKPAMLINNQYPGPTIRAAWGDTVIVNVKNSLQHNGTGIHWHGLRRNCGSPRGRLQLLHMVLSSAPHRSSVNLIVEPQLNTCQHDGVPGITECPIAPGKTRQYIFRATQFGTSWYHSHWSAQYGEGVLGTIIIDGPATANYDEDLGVLPLTDYYYKPAFEINEQAQLSRTGPPAPDNILVNGTHKNGRGGGSYSKIVVKPNKKYRVRLINTSVDTTFHVSFDNHPFTVMTSDFVPVKSFVASQLTLNIGQRYDVVITTNQTAGNYWFRVGLGTDCGDNNILDSGIPLGAILRYEGQPDVDPSSTGVTLATHCNDEEGLVPFVPNSVPASIIPGEAALALASKQDNSTENLFRWTIDGSSLVVPWTQPSLKTTLEGSDNFHREENIYRMPTKDKWYLWHIQQRTPIPLPHPIHLHGHDFYILGRGTGEWDGTTTGLNFQNPTRRDTAMLPSRGYLLMAFPADNPGLWVMHCHIAWHASQGLSVQFLERKDEIKGAIGSTAEFDKGCREWNEYWPTRVYNQTDSGI